MDKVSPDWAARIENLELEIEWLLTGARGGGAGFLQAPWTAVGSGVTAAAGRTKFAVTTTVGGATINFTGLQPGQIIAVRMVAGANPITVNPGAGLTIADPNNGGTQGASATISAQGSGAVWQVSGTQLILLVGA